VRIDDVQRQAFAAPTLLTPEGLELVAKDSDDRLAVCFVPHDFFLFEI
jgi:hypothetical protein